MTHQSSNTPAAKPESSDSNTHLSLHQPRKAYQPPTLILYGPLSELTQTGGSHSVSDAFHSAGKTA